MNRPDIDLLLDPVKRLTDDFLADLNRAAPKRRLALLLDTFEQLSALEEWARDLAQRLHPNVLLVIAGRAVPNWSRQWMGWLAQADVQELKPMTEAVMRALIERYYATMRGGSPDSAQVAAIVSFARGLPVVVTSAVRLWVEYGVEDFQAVKPQVMADLVDRLLEGVPRELVPVLEAAAAVRWFNKDLLRALLGQGDAPAAQLDAYSAYEAGLRNLLIRLNHQEAAHSDALIYQHRLAENIAQTRLYGDDNTRQAERAEIVAQLNALASSTLGSSFNELCDQVPSRPKPRSPIGDINKLYEDLRRFPFTRPRAEGLALHDAVREIIDESLRVHEPERHRELHEQAAAYFETRLAKATGQEAERLGLERLYHRIQADEETGVRLFLDVAAELVRYELLNRLRALLSDANSFSLERQNSRLWRTYYSGRLAHQEGNTAEAEAIYQAIASSQQAEPKLLAYALCDLGQIYARWERLGRPGGVEQAERVLERSRKLAPQMDSKLISVLSHLRIIAIYKAEWTKAIELMSQQLRLFEERGDGVGMVYGLSSLRVTYGQIGDWRKAADTEARGLEILRGLPENAFLRARLTGYGPWHVIWSGRYFEAEQRSREWMSFLQQTRSALGVVTGMAAFIVGLQGKYEEAEALFTESMNWYQQIQRAAARGGILGLYGKVLLRHGQLDRAEEYLTESFSLKREIQENVGSLEVVTWLGELHELRSRETQGDGTLAKLEAATRYYSQSLGLRGMGLRHYVCAALAGLIRVKHAQGDYAAIPPLLAEAEQLAQQYEYNDHLASLCLTQGHSAWDGNIPEWDEGFDAALAYYRQALIYALRYNRFLLDEALWGGGVGTPLRPIIPWCQQHGEEGRRMLVALRYWWQAGANDIGAPRPDTISPIPEGIPLLEAERIAREREPGDGTPQRTVSDILTEYI